MSKKRKIDKDHCHNALNPKSLKLKIHQNPYLDFFHKMEAKNKEHSLIFDPELDEEKRKVLMEMIDSDIAEKYSWAIPDERALSIIKHYGPIVEMGAGRGYWAKLLQLRGVDIVAYDLHTIPNDKTEENDSDESDSKPWMNWTNVKQGTPKILKDHGDRALLLCYPDDFEECEDSMALKCLKNFSGDIVIHVGELLGQTVCKPDPWGRTSAPEFQIYLNTLYHKILQVPLPSWHSSMDTLSVWKRTQVCFTDYGNYAYIPMEEKQTWIVSTPSTQHLI